MNLQWFVSFRGYDILDNMTLSPPIPDRELCAHFAMPPQGDSSLTQLAVQGFPTPLRPTEALHNHRDLADSHEHLLRTFYPRDPQVVRKSRVSSLRMVIKEREPFQEQ